MSGHLKLRGFTILEMMLVITVAAVILGLGVPNLQEFMRNNRMSSAANDLMTSIHSARSQAVKLHMPTIVCLSSDPLADTPACDGDGSQGWIVFVDDQDPAASAATDNNGQFDAGEQLLEQHTSLERVTVRPRPDGNDGYVAFAPNGFARAHPSLGVALTGVVLCDERGNVQRNEGGASAARAITVSVVGRPQTTRALADITALGGCP